MGQHQKDMPPKGLALKKINGEQDQEDHITTENGDLSLKGLMHKPSHPDIQDKSNRSKVARPQAMENTILILKQPLGKNLQRCHLGGKHGQTQFLQNHPNLLVTEN